MKDSVTQPDVLHDPRYEMLPAPPAEWARLWTRTSMLKEVRHLLETIGAWPDVAIAPGRNGLCLTLRGVPLGHLRWNGRIVLPFGPEMGDRLVAEKMATRDPDRPDTRRAVFDVRTVADVDRAIWLLRLAYLSGDPKVDVCAAGVADPPDARA